MKTILKIITSLFLAITLTFAASGQIHINIDSVSACPGDTILIPVTTTGFTGVAAISLIIPYDPAVLSLIGLANIHPQIAGTMANAVAFPSPELRIGWFTFGSNTANVGAGKLFDLKLVYHGGSTYLPVNPSSELADNNYDVIPTTYTQGFAGNGPTPSITQQPSSNWLCTGSPALFTVQANNALTREWQMFNGSSWVPVSNGSIYSGAGTDQLSIFSVNPLMHLNQYRLKLTNFCFVYSDVVTLHVSNPVVDAGADDTICFGNSTTIGATVTGGYAPFSYTWTTGGLSPSLVVSPAANQTYSVFVTDSLGCLTSDQMVVVVSNPSTFANGDDTICLGASKTILANTDGGIPPYSFAWQHGGNQWQTAVSPTLPTTYTVVSTDAFGCVSMSSATIDVSAPTVYAGDNDTICTGAYTTLFAGNTGGYVPFQYHWSNQATTQQIVVSPTQNTGYSVTVTDRFNCTATSQTQVVVSSPVTSVGSDDTLCLGQQKTITALTTGGFTPYQHAWSNSQTTPAITLTPMATAPYSVTVTDRFGCISGDNITIFVSNPAIDAGPHDTICFGAQTTIATSTSGGFLPYQFVWSNMANTANIQVSPANTTWYKVTVTDHAGCSAIDSMLVAVSLPTVSLGNNDTICINASATLTAVPGGGFGALQYLWSNSTNHSSITVTPATTTTYSVTLTDQYNCQATASKAVIVSNPLANAGADQGACVGTPVTFNGTASNGFTPYSYSWNNNPGQSYQLTTTTNTSLVLKATDKFGCIATDTALLTAWPNPVIAPISDDTACYNTANMLTAIGTGGTGTLSYLWNTNATTASINPVITQNTTFWVRATDINNCKASDTVLVLVSNPAVTLGANDTVCKGDIVPLSGQIAGGFSPFSYVWSTGGTTSSVNLTANSDTCAHLTITDKVGCIAKDTVCILISHIQANAGADQGACIGTPVTFNGTASNGFAPYSYSWNNNPGQSYQITTSANATLVLKATDKFGCQATDTALLTAWPNPVIAPIMDDTVCVHAIATLTAAGSGGTGTLSYLWNTNAISDTITPIITQNSQFWVKVTDVNNCHASDTVMVYASNPQVDLGANLAGCFGTLLPLQGQLTGGFGPFTHLWSTGDVTPQISHAAMIDTCISLIITDIIGCETMDTVCIVVNPLPAPNLGPNDTICINHTKILDPGAGFTSYLWSTGASSPTLLIDGALLGVGAFTYHVTVTNQFACQNADTITIVVDPCDGIEQVLSQRYLSIYPNPASDQLFITFDYPGDYLVTITGSQGQQLLKQALSQQSIEPQQIDISQIAPGIYVVYIATKDGTIVRKLVVR
jgi:hypothetical protein